MANHDKIHGKTQVRFLSFLPGAPNACLWMKLLTSAYFEDTTPKYSFVKGHTEIKEVRMEDSLGT